MKAKIFLTAVAVALSLTTANAKIWRVNPNANSGAQYTNFAALMNDYDFQEGDTILCDPGYYGSPTISVKNITIIGSGYLHSQNTDWSEAGATSFGNITLAEGCKLIGVSGRPMPGGNNIEISRCIITSTYPAYYITGLVIERCLCYTLEDIYKANGVEIRNCIVLDGIAANSTGTSWVIENNTIIKNTTNYVVYNLRNAIVRNNIIINTKEGMNSDRVKYSEMCLNFSNLNNCTVTNNVFGTSASNANAVYPNNKFCGATLANTFINEGSDDGKYRLKDDSPAKGAASHGGDCGAFGGSTPYILSGIPAFMPQITNAIVPDAPTNGKINVKLTINTRNE